LHQRVWQLIVWVFDIFNYFKNCFLFKEYDNADSSNRYEIMKKIIFSWKA